MQTGSIDSTAMTINSMRIYRVWTDVIDANNRVEAVVFQGR